MDQGPGKAALDSDHSLGVEWVGASLLDIGAVVTLAGGIVLRSARWRTTKAGATGTQNFRARCGPLDLDLEVSEGRDAVLSLQLSARARTPCEVSEIGIEVRPLLGGAEPEWFRYSGYQSWDRAGIRGVTEQGLQSWWLTGLADESGLELAWAASTCGQAGTRFEYRDQVLRIVNCPPPWPATVATIWEADSGDDWRGECVDVALVSGDTAGWRAVMVSQTSATAEGRPAAPQGWLSWYCYGAWVGPEDILRNAQVLNGPEFAGLGYQFIQVDDGWQQAFGDWSPNSRFSDLKNLVKGLRAAGQTAGIWTAPFLVASDSELARTAPEDWFLHESDGRRLRDPRDGVPGEMYVLDGARREVGDHLAKTFARLYECGFRYFKIDYLYAGAYGGFPGYGAALKSIRDAVRDSYLLACGAPLLPAARLANGCRIAEDTARPIYNFETGRPEPTLFGDEVQWAARNLAARLPMADWFQLDLDIALVGGNIDRRQARQLVTLAALSGGPFFSGDDLPNVPGERRALLRNPEILALVGRGPARPVWEPLPGELPPSVWWLGESVVVIFNWTAKNAAAKVRRPGSWLVRDLWLRKDFEPFTDMLEVDLPSNGVRVLALEAAS